MCLTLTKSSRILTARRNIVVYKELQPSYSYYSRSLGCSPYYNHDWYKNKVEVVPAFTNAKDERFVASDKMMRRGRGVVNAGLHSRTKKAAQAQYSKGRQFEGIIPKGTKYIRGAYGEVVSLALKLTGRKLSDIRE